MDVGAQEYFAPQPFLLYRFYEPMPAASSGTLASRLSHMMAGFDLIDRGSSSEARKGEEDEDVGK
ncbi:hypothetical protein COLO4_38505 [Corchorus olitorius]|uniref:Uncharacterized protein n=1 Tax=Corchorus olitorius TaxID=93759 RepID=A0A1R3FUU0_9ROSI|nr:hypothetical protein COLO4_38505 [Corchorus olitorius]